jgi:hypothetical protein
MPHGSGSGYFHESEDEMRMNTVKACLEVFMSVVNDWKLKTGEIVEQLQEGDSEGALQRAQELYDELLEAENEFSKEADSSN